MSITLRNIDKYFEEIIALKNVNLKINSNETTIFIGPSGCGKSTLLSIILGILKPTKGEVLIDEININELEQNTYRRKIGFGIQDGGLFPNLTAFGNITLTAKYLTWPNDKIKSRVKELCSLTKFPLDGLNRFPSELSGGQKQRVSLMRALMLNPDMLLLDEPLAALDPMIKFELQNDLKTIFAELNKTVLFVTHDITEAAYLGDKIVIMKDGKIIQAGKIEELKTNPADAFVTEFINAQRTIAL